jgi:sulfur carrier protein ThiS
LIIINAGIPVKKIISTGKISGTRGNTMYNAPMITVRLPQKKTTFETPGPRRVMDLLAEAGVRPTTVIVTQERKLLTKDHRVEDGATIDVISVVSGG